MLFESRLFTKRAVQLAVSAANGFQYGPNPYEHEFKRDLDSLEETAPSTAATVELLRYNGVRMCQACTMHRNQIQFVSSPTSALMANEHCYACGRGNCTTDRRDQIDCPFVAVQNCHGSLVSDMQP